MFTLRPPLASTSTSCLCRLLHSIPIDLPTIFAPATGRTRSAIAILRISGPKSLQIYHGITRPPKPRQALPARAPAVVPDGKGKGKAPEGRRAVLRRIVNPATGEVLDEGIVLYFPGELRVDDMQPNGVLLMRVVLRSLFRPDGPRYARAAHPRQPSPDGPLAQTTPYYRRQD